MKTNATVKCVDFPCTDTNRHSYLVPGLEVDPARVSILLISEASPVDPQTRHGGMRGVTDGDRHRIGSVLGLQRLVQAQK